MTKQEFIKFFNSIIKYNKEVDRWNDFGIEFFELPIHEITWEVYNTLMNSIFTEDGVDWINWWLFEASENSKYFWIEDKQININTPEEFWDNCIKDCLK